MTGFRGLLLTSSTGAKSQLMPSGLSCSAMSRAAARARAGVARVADLRGRTVAA